MNVLGFSSQAVGKSSAKNLFGITAENTSAQNDGAMNASDISANDVARQQTPQLFQLLLGFLLPSQTKINVKENIDVVNNNEIANTTVVNSNNENAQSKQTSNILGVADEHLQVLKLHNYDQANGIIGFSMFPQTGFLFDAGTDNNAAAPEEVMPVNQGQFAKNQSIATTQQGAQVLQLSQVLPNNASEKNTEQAKIQNTNEQSTVELDDMMLPAEPRASEKINNKNAFAIPQNIISAQKAEKNIVRANEISSNILQSAEPLTQQVPVQEQSKQLEAKQPRATFIQRAAEINAHESTVVNPVRTSGIETLASQKEAEPMNDWYRAIVEASTLQAKATTNDKKNIDSIKSSKENNSTKILSFPAGTAIEAQRNNNAIQEIVNPRFAEKNITGNAKENIENVAQTNSETKSLKAELVADKTAAVASKVETPDTVVRQVKNETTIQPIALGTQHTATIEAPKEVQAPAPMHNREMVFEQILKDVSSITHTPHSLEIKLSPEHLGKVEIKIGLEEGKMNARIDVQNTDVKQIVENNIAKMRETLHNNGITLDSINIFLSSETTQQQYKQQEIGKKKFGHMASHLDEIAEVADGDREAKTFGYNTVEYII